MHRFLYFTVFASGFTTLAIELSASRLLGSAFGTSNLVWASIIGLILIYLTVGYFIGGRWADRNPNARTLYTILAWGAFTAGLVPLPAQIVLRLASAAFDELQVGVLFGSFAVVLVLFSLPVTLLGTISPFAIRIAITDPQKAGQISGKIYAISTLGSFIGTFVPVLVMIPLLGTNFTFLSFSAFLLLVAMIGFALSEGWRSAMRKSWMLIILALVAFLLSGKSIKASPGQIFETESAYNYIQVLERDGFRYLRLNEGQGIHSVWHPTVMDYSGPWEQFLAAPFFNPSPFTQKDVRRIAIIGLAAGTVARQSTAVFGALPIDGYEIDPGIIEVGQKFFGMTMPNLNAYAQDGRLGLASSPWKYGLIGIDAYRPPYIPWHLTTREFFQIVFDHLTPDGVMVINVGHSPNDRRLVDGLVSTVQTLFPSVYVMDVPLSFNAIVYATRHPTRMQNLYDNFLFLTGRKDTHPLLLASIQRVIENQRPISESQVVFTDDWAPIEWITNEMVLNYVLFGDLEALEENPQ